MTIVTSNEIFPIHKLIVLTAFSGDCYKKHEPKATELPVATGVQPPLCSQSLAHSLAHAEPKLMQKRYLFSILAALAGLSSSFAAISVTPTGSAVLQFDTQPAIVDWSTLTGIGGPDDVFDAASLDAAVQTHGSADVISALGSSGTVPPSANVVARRNTNLQVIQSRPNGATSYILQMATLQNNTGGNVAFLNITYTFGLEIEAGSVAAEEVPGLRGFYSLTGAAGSWQLVPAFTTATPGVVATSLELGSWANGANLYILWADDDATAHTTAPNQEGAWTIDNFQAVPSAGREALLTGFTSTPIGFVATITDGAAPLTVNLSTMNVTLNGAPITPQVSKAGETITVSFTGNTLPANSTNDLVFSFSDNNTPAKAYTINRQWIVGPYQVLPASFAVTGVDTSKPGFKARVHQLPVARGPGDVNSIENAEKQLANAFIDPATGEPYPNEADLSLAVNGIFEIPTVINWNENAPAPAGNFHDTSTPPVVDDPIPGIPGPNFLLDHVAAEIITFLELKKGVYTMGVNSDDGFKVTAGGNPRDALSLVLGSFSGGRAAADTLFDIVVEADGIYPFRLAWWEGTGDASVEWFTVDESGQKVLINDRSIATAVKAYSEGPAASLFVRSISPFPGVTNATGDSAINIVLADGATQVQPNTVQLFVNNQPVNPTVTKPAGSTDTTINYDLPGIAAPESIWNVRLVFGDSAGVLRTNEYTFQIKPLVLVGIDETTLWRYENNGLDLGTAWREKDFNDSAWPEGAAVLAAESGATAEPIRTELLRSSPEGNQIVTDYFRRHFTFNGNPAAVQLLLRHIVDDGVVFYLNGTEIHRFGTPASTVVSNMTFFSGHENEYEGPFVISGANLVRGENVLAAEVHQSDAGSSDSVFGAELLAAVLTNVAPTTVVSVSPAPDASNVASNTVIQIVLSDGSREVNTNSIQLSVNGQPVTPTISKPPEGIATTITYDPPADFAPDSLVTVNFSFADDAGTVTTQALTFRVVPTYTVLFGIDDTKMWRYENSGTDLGTSWREKNFDDSLWAEGPALLAAETGNTPEPIRTQLVRTGVDGITQIMTDYSRTHFNFTGDPATARLRIRHVVDDAVAVYLNGAEVHRFGFPEGAPIVNATPGSDHENRYEGPFDIPVASLVQGDNVIAAEVHQTGPTSSDSVFGLELQLVTSPAPPAEARFTSVSRTGADLRIEWNGGGTLESTDQLGGTWAPVANAGSPYTTPISGSARFFRVRQ